LQKAKLINNLLHNLANYYAIIMPYASFHLNFNPDIFFLYSGLEGPILLDNLEAVFLSAF